MPVKRTSIQTLRQAMVKAGLDPTNEKLVDFFLEELNSPETLDHAAQQVAKRSGTQLLDEHYSSAADAAKAANQTAPAAAGQPSQKTGRQLLADYYKNAQEQTK